MTGVIVFKLQTILSPQYCSKPIFHRTSKLNKPNKQGLLQTQALLINPKKPLKKSDTIKFSNIQLQVCLSKILKYTATSLSHENSQQYTKPVLFPYSIISLIIITMELISNTTPMSTVPISMPSSLNIITMPLVSISTLMSTISISTPIPDDPIHIPVKPHSGLSHILIRDDIIILYLVLAPVFSSRSLQCPYSLDYCFHPFHMPNSSYSNASHLRPFTLFHIFTISNTLFSLKHFPPSAHLETRVTYLTYLVYSKFHPSLCSHFSSLFSVHQVSFDSVLPLKYCNPCYFHCYFSNALSMCYTHYEHVLILFFELKHMFHTLQSIISSNPPHFPLGPIKLPGLSTSLLRSISTPGERLSSIHSSGCCSTASCESEVQNLIGLNNIPGKQAQELAGHQKINVDLSLYNLLILIKNRGSVMRNLSCPFLGLLNEGKNGVNHIRTSLGCRTRGHNNKINKNQHQRCRKMRLGWDLGRLQLACLGETGKKPDDRLNEATEFIQFSSLMSLVIWCLMRVNDQKEKYSLDSVRKIQMRESCVDELDCLQVFLEGILHLVLDYWGPLSQDRFFLDGEVAVQKFIERSPILNSKKHKIEDGRFNRSISFWDNSNKTKGVSFLVEKDLETRKDTLSIKKHTNLAQLEDEHFQREQEQGISPDVDEIKREKRSVPLIIFSQEEEDTLKLDDLIGVVKEKIHSDSGLDGEVRKYLGPGNHNEEAEIDNMMPEYSMWFYFMKPEVIKKGLGKKNPRNWLNDSHEIAVVKHGSCLTHSQAEMEVGGLIKKKKTRKTTPGESSC
ncbi:hypothetical protein VP01_48g3 [Puccinia sorghi]|uniref:Uncharacterized protein n=1 Tax=Puccinia sorghi TaxID=27349 RepID=A0A0L6UM48_9BASI|nr:hypothetical protein VP01_48g3 [Puccinia sorghi]